MKKKMTLTLMSASMAILMLSFQCEKPYKDNHTILIEGQFQDANGSPIPYFEFFISHRDFSEGLYLDQRSSEKSIKTDAFGKFKILTPMIQETRSRIPAMVFVDTTWLYEIELPNADIITRHFVPFYTNGNSNNTLDFGTLILQQ